MLAASGLAAAPRFEVSGVVAATDEALDVRVDVKNTGDAPATPLIVAGELFGTRREARFEKGLAPGQLGSAHLLFPLEVPRGGVHALPLLIEYPEGGAADAAGNPPMASQRAYLLLALGGATEPAVRIDTPPVTLDTRGTLAVGLTSLDGAPHRVRLSVFTARGLRAETPPLEVDVPAQGKASTLVTLIRSGAPRGSSHGVLVVAGASDGPLERTSVATSVVSIAPDHALMPALRLPLLVLAGALLAAAAFFEVRRASAGSPAEV